MANQPSDRQRMRNDLRELARTAKPGSDSPIHGFDTADSSGYVDLSAYSTSDPGWVDRELARARNGAQPARPPQPPRGATVRSIDVLMPASMAPVSLEVSGEPEDTMNVRPSRARGALYTTLGLAAVAGVGLLAFTLAKHPPPAQAPATVAAAAVAPPPVDPPAPPPAVTAAATSTPTTAAVAVAPTTPAAATHATVTVTTGKTRKSFSGSRAHVVAQTPAAAPAHAAAAPAAVVIPKAKASSGGDSLMDLIKKSVATGK
ncbi:MAG TPA: hypothetical protein VGL81_19095 [Polyangiaceae bacterium]|jgi:hypothetical protein